MSSGATAQGSEITHSFIEADILSIDLICGTPRHAIAMILERLQDKYEINI